MQASARIEQDLRSAGLDWITALRSVQIRALVDSGFLQLSLFDRQDLAASGVTQKYRAPLAGP